MRLRSHDALFQRNVRRKHQDASPRSWSARHCADGHDQIDGASCLVSTLNCTSGLITQKATLTNGPGFHQPVKLLEPERIRLVLKIDAKHQPGLMALEIGGEVETGRCARRTSPRLNAQPRTSAATISSVSTIGNRPSARRTAPARQVPPAQPPSYFPQVARLTARREAGAAAAPSAPSAAPAVDSRSNDAAADQARPLRLRRSRLANAAMIRSGTARVRDRTPA